MTCNAVSHTNRYTLIDDIVQTQPWTMDKCPVVWHQCSYLASLYKHNTSKLNSDMTLAPVDSSQDFYQLSVSAAAASWIFSSSCFWDFSSSTKLL